MIIRDTRLILLNQTIAYKNEQLEFVDFTDNLLALAGVKHEDAILGRRDQGDDLPWSAFGADYEAHDRDALNSSNYGSIVPFQGTEPGTQAYVFCSRSKCLLPNGQAGVYIHVLPVLNPDINQLLQNLTKTEPAGLHPHHFIGKNPSDIHLTQKESECLFYLMRGKASKFIASVMRISCRTVEFHIDNLKHKFACRTKAELISCAIQKGYMSIIPETILTHNLAAGLAAVA